MAFGHPHDLRGPGVTRPLQMHQIHRQPFPRGERGKLLKDRLKGLLALGLLGRPHPGGGFRKRRKGILPLPAPDLPGQVAAAQLECDRGQVGLEGPGGIGQGQAADPLLEAGEPELLEDRLGIRGGAPREALPDQAEEEGPVPVEEFRPGLLPTLQTGLNEHRIIHRRQASRKPSRIGNIP